MANYLWAISGHEGTNWQIKGTALACYTLATLTLVFNTKYAYWFSNAVGIVKVCTILFVIITGFVVLGGNTKVENPTANFKDAWSGSSNASAYGMTIALYRIIFSYGGYNNAFNVANEVKVRRRSCGDGTRLTQFLTEPCAIAQDLCHHRLDYCVYPIHVCKCCILCCW